MRVFVRVCMCVHVEEVREMGLGTAGQQRGVVWAQVNWVICLPDSAALRLGWVTS